MKEKYQIYLFASALVVAAAFFILRSPNSDRALYPSEGPSFKWEVHDFGDALFGGDSLNMEELTTYFNPFFQSNPIPNFWKQERANPTLRDHFVNVQNLMDKEAIAQDLNVVSSRAQELLNAPEPEALYFYISGIDLETPCLFYPGAKGDPSKAFVGLDNFLGVGYPGYEFIPAYQRSTLRQSQIPVEYAHAILATMGLENFNDPTLLGQMIYHGKIGVASDALTGYGLEPAEILGYLPQEWAFLEENERNIWEVLVREQLLFSTDPLVRQRLIEPAPFSKFGTAQDTEIPGRAARFIGYQLVKSYAEHHPELGLKELLKIRDAQKFLRDAQYKP